jgi:hypothetical protein
VTRRALRILDINVEAQANVPQNRVIEIRFNATPAKRSVNPAQFRIRAQNATGTGFTKQVPGEFQVFGNTVRFFPRLPTHRRDPTSTDDEFYSEGSERDDAAANAGLQPDTNVEIKIIGHPSVAAVRAAKGGRKLNRTVTARFSTASEAPKTSAFTVDEYIDSPPPGFEFSNPSDKVASAADQYAKHGGTADVPSAVAVTLFGNKVPLSPATLRTGTNVSLRLLERGGDPSLAKDVAGVPYVEQNYETTRLVYQPRFPLPDVGVYAYRVTKDVKDLTETFTFKNNAERLRLREIYEFMLAARALQPGVPPEMLDDPPLELIFDWPASAEARGVLKRNVLDLGDTYPEEVDPRVMVLFSTRDEPVSEGKIVIEFLKDENIYDEALSTATWDEEPFAGTVAAVHTVAAGSGADGNYNPTSDETISTDTYEENTINWRNVFIPQGVTVTLTGSKPATIKCLQFHLEGEIHADGDPGTNASTGSYSNSYGGQAQTKGGKGGPGGGKGADSSTTFAAGSRGNTGTVGNTIDGRLAFPNEGGRGGQGGQTAPNGNNATIYKMGAGGGGGGARTAGGRGANTNVTVNGWANGVGGAGGAGSTNPAQDPLVGGGGGGSGGNAIYPSIRWSKTAGAGAGAGGALLVQTAGTVTILGNGLISVRGGKGGNGTGSNGTLSAGPGGGGGGGSVLVRTSRGFNLTNGPAAFDVRGGNGGTQSGNYVAPTGGFGGTGYIRLESPSGGLGVPGGTQGDFNPVGGGVPSIAYSTFLDVGVEGPRFVNFTPADLTYNPGPDDALLIEAQFAIEDTDNFGQPDLDALDTTTQESNDVDQISNWLPILVADNTPTAGGAFPDLVGYDRTVDGTPKLFEFASQVNGKSFKFVRFRYTFQLDDTQTTTDPLPNVSRMVLNFQFNT